MSSNFNRPQDAGGDYFILPPRTDEVVPMDDIVRVVDVAVDFVDMKPVEETYKLGRAGRAPFFPIMMLKGVLLNIIEGNMSTRKMEYSFRYDLRYRFLMESHAPDHSTIASYINKVGEHIDHVFVEILRRCKEKGMLKLGVFVLDGTKVKANASIDENNTPEWFEKEIQRIRKEILDEAERDEPGRVTTVSKSQRTDEQRLAHFQDIAATMRNDRERRESERREKVEAWEARAAETGKRPSGRKPGEQKRKKEKDPTRNSTDSDSRVMKTKMGFEQCHNGQLIVDGRKDGWQLAIFGRMCSDANDVGQFCSMEDCLRWVLGELYGEEFVDDFWIGVLLADASYWCQKTLERVRKGLEIIVAPQNGRRMRAEQREREPPRGRIPKGISSADKMARKLRTKRGQELYRQRASVEAVFGQLKTCQESGKLLRRGTKKCSLEWKLHLTAHNLRKLCLFMSRESPGGRSACMRLRYGEVNLMDKAVDGCN